MTEEFKIGEVVEFLGCELTQLLPFPAVKILLYGNSGKDIQIEFPPGCRYLNGSLTNKAVIQWVNKSSLKKIKKIEPIKQSFKVGDRVERVSNDIISSYIKKGALGTVKEIVDDTTFKVLYDGTQIRWHTYKHSHKLISTPTQLTTALPPFKKETPPMNLKIITSQKVNGVETKDLTVENIASFIKDQQNKIKSLEDVTPKTKKITAALRELRTDLAAFVEHMDSLPEQ